MLYCSRSNILLDHKYCSLSTAPYSVVQAGRLSTTFETIVSSSFASAGFGVHSYSIESLQLSNVDGVDILELNLCEVKV